MKKRLFFIIVFVLFGITLLLTSTAWADEGTITVTIQGFNNDNGCARVALFASKDGFPFESDKAFKTLQAPIKDGKSAVIFNDIPYGDYAISLYHDDNDNGRLDLSFWGKPLKGVGVSNNPPKHNSTPRFEEVQFTLNSDKLEMEITVIYY